MKKIIKISMLAATLAATSAFGQGYLILQSPANSQIWDGFSTAGVATRTTAVDVGLFWAVNGTANPMAALLASTPTTGNSTTAESYTTAQAWAAVLGSSFTLAAQTTTAPNGSVIATDRKSVV